MFFAIAGRVLASNEGRRLAPDVTLTILRTNIVTLVVRRSEDIVANQAERQKTERLCLSQVCWISGEILCLKCVETRKECHISPCEHPSEMIVADINRSGVPIFVVEEIDNVDCMEERDDNH